MDMEIERLKELLNRAGSKNKILQILDLIDEDVIRDSIEIGFTMTHEGTAPLEETLKKHAITGAIIAVMSSPEFKILKEYISKE